MTTGRGSRNRKRFYEIKSYGHTLCGTHPNIIRNECHNKKNVSTQINKCH
jgi:hypothetical protein